MKNKLPNRKNPRLHKYDYSTPGAYFITVCTHKRAKILSCIVGAIHESPKIKLTEYGEIVDRIINNLPNHLGVKIDKYVIMPNHIHFIMSISNSKENRAIRESPLRSHSIISSTVGYIKMNASKEIHKLNCNVTVWQRSFHDHIIRNDDDYYEIAKYIEGNPRCWQYDSLYKEE